MRVPAASLWFVLGLVAGGLACGPALVAQPGPGGPGPTAPPAATAASAGVLVLDRTDLRIGTAVQFAHVPTATELDDLRFVPGFQRLVLTLDAWPEGVDPLTPLGRLPAEVDLLVVLAGYPPSRAAVAAWNQLPAPARIVIVAQGPPDAGLVDDLNQLRGLERVVVDTEAPSRAGFERLQRPVSFRVLRE